MSQQRTNVVESDWPATDKAGAETIPWIDGGRPDHQNQEPQPPSASGTSCFISQHGRGSVQTNSGCWQQGHSMEETYYVPTPPAPLHTRVGSHRHSYSYVQQPDPPQSYPQPRAEEQPSRSSSTHRYSITSQSQRVTPTYPHGASQPVQSSQPPARQSLQSKQLQPQIQTYPLRDSSQERRTSHHTSLQDYDIPNESPVATRRPKQLPAPISPVSLSTASPYMQFCNLIGIPAPPITHPFYPAWKSTLYARVTRSHRHKQWEYWFTASVGNFLLLLQILISATVTALGATRSPHISITILGAIGTIVAGVITYLKSRGQPMRARTFRNELGKCLGAIEDAEAMFLGVSEGVDGYDVTDAEGGIEGGHEVTVREEVERLTTMYEAAVINAQNNYPDLWASAQDGAPTKKGRNGRLVTGGMGAKNGPKIVGAGAGVGRIPHATGIKV